MKKSILLLSLMIGLMITKTDGQTTDNKKQLIGDWYACGIKSIQTNDTVTFFRKDTTCMNADCIFFRWIINNKGKLKSGWQQGCEDLIVGFDLRKSYKWTFDMNKRSMIINKSNIIETYRIIFLRESVLQVIRLE